RVLSTGGFHNGAAAPAFNWLTASWADLALVAQRQVTAMHSPTSGLPHLLAPAGFIPGASGGATNLFGWVATGLVEEARALAAPTLLPATINDTKTTSPRPPSAPTAASTVPPNASTASSPSWPWAPARHCPSPTATRHHPWPDC
ncbi:MAG TPA: hypothetical protein VNZ67_12105, partial [bacterium]|nr:hypothetical protein [bacterium]